MNNQEELILRCKRGDPAALTALYHEHAGAVYNTIFRLVNHTAEAEDILQETFVAAFQGLEHFIPSATFRTWIKRIAFNKSIDSIRKRKISFKPLEPDWMTPVPEEVVDEAAFQWTMEAIAAAIDGLPDNYRTVFSLYAVENIPQADIAQMLGMEPGAVRTMYHRAKQKLLITIKGMKHEQ